MKGISKLLTAALLALLTSYTYAKPYYGGTFSTVAITKEPMSLRGYQFMLVYDPQKFKWHNFDLYFDGGFSYFSASSTPIYTALNIYSAAPILRYSFEQRGPAQAFLELSVGPAYLNHTRLENRNLGIHFSFQDRAGIGVMLGHEQKLVLGLSALHYSNARLSGHNSGITALMMLNVGYRFS